MISWLILVWFKVAIFLHWPWCFILFHDQLVRTNRRKDVLRQTRDNEKTRGRRRYNKEEEEEGFWLIKHKFQNRKEVVSLRSWLEGKRGDAGSIYNEDKANWNGFTYPYLTSSKPVNLRWVTSSHWWIAAKRGDYIYVYIYTTQLY